MALPVSFCLHALSCKKRTAQVAWEDAPTDRPSKQHPTNLSPNRYYGVEERIELWGLQIPHNSVRPPLVEEGAEPVPTVSSDTKLV